MKPEFQRILKKKGIWGTLGPCLLVIAGKNSVSQHREARTVARTRTGEQLHCKASSVQSVSFTAVLLPKRAMPGGVPLTQNLSSRSSERIMVLLPESGGYDHLKQGATNYALQVTAFPSEGPDLTD